MMEILRFDSRRPNPKYLRLIDLLRERLSDVLVIAHGGTVRVLDAYARGVPVDQMTWRPVDNATIVRIPEFGTLSRGGNR